MIGQVPWTREDMIAKLEGFALLNEKRPVRENLYGMRSPHMFLAWFVLGWLQPLVIVESGVARGQGSWFFAKACPSAQFYCIDPRPELRSVTLPQATYFERDFGVIDWSGVSRDAVLFFDDHQNAFERVKQARQLGFTRMLFEDNYPAGRGDCYSLKAAFENEAAASYLCQVLEVYQELPPVCKCEKTRWGTDWNVYSTPDPLLLEAELPYQRVFQDEADTYTWMCYVQCLPIS